MKYCDISTSLFGYDMNTMLNLTRLQRGWLASD